MPEKVKIQKYLDFMHWFQATQPALYADHWQNIEVIGDAEELKIKVVNACESVCIIINELTANYFNIENKDSFHSRSL